MKKGSIVHRFTERADLPGESLPMQPLVEVCGNNRVLIENHRGVSEYSDDRIGVRVRFGTVCICGEGLKLCRMSGCQLVVTGMIHNIQLFRG